MRPPKEKWRLTAEAIAALYKLIMSLEGVKAPVTVVSEAALKIDALTIHVNESEECES